MKLIRDMAMDGVCTHLRDRTDGPRPIDLCRGSSGFNVQQYIDLGLAHPGLDKLARYQDSAGLPLLRDGLSTMLCEAHGVDISPDRICVTDGASGALLVALWSMLDPGTEALIPEWAYPFFKVLVSMVGAKCVFVPVTDEFKFDLDELEKRVTPRTRAIILNTPVNPFGSVYTKEELARITSLGIPVVSDEVYSLLVHTGAAPSVLEIEGEHVVAGSFSKIFSLPSLRIGYLVLPAHKVERIVAIKRHLNVVTSIPSQLLAGQIVKHWRKLAGAHVSYLRDCRQVFLKEARDLSLLRVPEAGLFATVDVSNYGRSDVVARDLCRRENLAVAPSSDFEAADANDCQVTRPLEFLRVNYCADATDLPDGISRLKRYLGALGTGSQRLSETAAT